MNKELFVKLSYNYNKEPNEKLYKLWKEELKEYPDKSIEDAILKIIKEDKYMPNLARIIEAIEEKSKIPSWLFKDIKGEYDDNLDTDFINFIKEFRGE